MKKGLFLLRGESFRTGGQFSRNIGSDIVFEDQISAAISHKKLIDKLISEGNTIHVAIDTISTKFDDELRKVYGEIQSYNFKSKHDYSQYFGIQRAIDNVEHLIKANDYDFLVISRNDIFLRDKFFELFDVNDDVVKFPSVCWYENRKLPTGLPRVVDAIYFIPKKYFSLRKIFRMQMEKDGHDILQLWAKFFPHVKYDFYLNTFHDGNTIHDYHPIYRMIGRPECLTMRSDPNLTYPEDF